MQFNKIVALVPMRHHSQRVPGKNYRILAGQPLYAHVLANLLHCPEINQIVVDTDSPEITAGIKERFPTITILPRPAHLQADGISMNEVLLYDTAHATADLYLQTHSTNPLVKAETFSHAIKTLEQNFPAFDSLFTVTKLQVRLWDALARPINHNPNFLLQTQDLPPLFEENSCFYLFTGELLTRKRNRVGDRPYLFELQRSEAYDIDDEENFLIADLLLSHRQGKKSQK
jgi:CMP-N-acetylneuraminic acid synthetase